VEGLQTARDAPQIDLVLFSHLSLDSAAYIYAVTSVCKHM